MWGSFWVTVLGLAALLGQREALLILLLWILWPAIRQILHVSKKKDKKEEEKGVVKVDGELITPKPSRARGALPRTTRPALPDPDVVDVEFRELPAPPIKNRWRILGAVVAALGLLLIGGGMLGLVLSILSLFF